MRMKKSLLLVLIIILTVAYIPFISSQSAIFSIQGIVDVPCTKSCKIPVTICASNASVAFPPNSQPFFTRPTEKSLKVFRDNIPFNFGGKTLEANTCWNVILEIERKETRRTLSTKYGFDFTGFKKEAFLIPDNSNKGSGFSKTRNQEGTSQVLIGNVWNIKEDQEWRDFKDVRSWIGSVEMRMVQKDDRYNITLEDANFSFVSLTLSSKTYPTPFTWCHIDSNSCFSSVINNQQTIRLIVGNPLSYNFTLGESSTTVQLQTAGTESLEEQGTCISGPLCEFGNRWYVKFNITSVPANQYILDAQLCLNVIVKQVGWNNIVTHYRVVNQTWDSEAPDAQYYADLNTANETNETGKWTSTGSDCINVTTHVNEEYSVGNPNVSVKIIDTDDTRGDDVTRVEIGSFDAIGDDISTPNDGILFKSLDHGDVSDRPYLNITYSHFQIESPDNISYAVNTIDFNITSIGNVNSANYSLDGAANETMTNDSATHFYNLSINHSTLSDGIHNITFFVESEVDGVDLQTVFFAVDVSIPAVTIDSPTNTTLFNESVWFNISVQEENPDTGLIQVTPLSPSGEAINYTLTNSSGVWNYQNASMTDGQYEALFFMNDTFGNINDSELVVFTVSTAPIVTVESPENISYDTADVNYILSSGRVLDTVFASIDGGANITLAPVENFTDSSTFTETDPNNRITINNASAISFDRITYEEVAYVQGDYGTDYFTTSFTHRFKVIITDEQDLSGNDPRVDLWFLTDSAAGVSLTGGEPMFTYAGGSEAIRQFDLHDNDFNVEDVSVEMTLNETYYVTIIREGQSLQATLRTVNYSGSVFDTLSVTLEDSGDLYRYIYVTMVRDDLAMNVNTTGVMSDLVFNTSTTGTRWANFSGDHPSLSFGSHNITYFANDTSGRVNHTDIVTFTINDITLPVINSNSTSPASPVYNSNVTIIANVTDPESSIVWVNFTFLSPNGTNVIDNENGTNYNTDLWNSSSYVIDREGEWQITINVSNVNNQSSSSTFNLTIDLGTMTVTSPEGDQNYSFSQVAGSSTLFNITLTHNGTSNNTIDLNLTSELNITSNFTVTFGEDPTTVEESETQRILVNITLSSSLASGTYNGNITWNRTDTNTIAQSGVIEIEIENSALVGEVDIVNSSWAASITTITSQNIAFLINATGNFNLSECLFSIISTISGASITSSPSNFDMENGTSQTVNTTISSTSGGNDASAIITLKCTATSSGGKNSDSVGGSFAVSVPPVGGGGGSSPQAECGNGFCERGESPESCFQDCQVARANFTFGVTPSSGVIRRIFIPEAVYKENVVILNPNAQNISVAVDISCVENDPSCEWLVINKDEITTTKTLNVIVEGGTVTSPGRKLIEIVMVIPAGVNESFFRSLVNFRAIGEIKVVSFEIVPVGALGFFGAFFGLLGDPLLSAVVLTAVVVALVLLFLSGQGQKIIVKVKKKF